MSELPDPALLEAIAAELGVDPSFVEKDWHAVRLVARLVRIEHETLRPVFSGGTSLSKGYGLIRRFSEDLDFKLTVQDGGTPRAERRRYRDLVIAAIRSAGDWTLEDRDIESRNESRFFGCLVGYPNAFAPTQALRPQLKLEVTFSAPALLAEDRPLRSFVAEARNEAPEVAAIACVSPVETAADKLSALTWRVLTRERGGKRDDPAMIRHLHDLAALEERVTEHPEFPGLLQRLIAEDAASRGSTGSPFAALPSEQRLGKALEIVATDPGYREEYDRFVRGMSYAEEHETPSFDNALEAARRLAKRVF